MYAASPVSSLFNLCMKPSSSDFGINTVMLKKLARNIPFVAGHLPSLSMLMSPTQRKYLPAWFRSRRKDYLLDHAIPWLTFDAVNFLREHLSPGVRVFEYGSGSSTLFWSTYQAHCISVEHDLKWGELLKKRFSSSFDIDLRLVGPDEQTTSSADDRDYADPNSYWSDWSSLTGLTFQEYASQIDSFPEGSFDVVLVDGQVRPACIKHSWAKVKSGGMLIVDNVDVPYHLARARQYLAGFERHSFYGIAPIHGALSQTDIYVAP